MRKHILITHGDGIDPNSLSRAQKFVGGFICNVHPDNLTLMRRAAKRLQIEITEGEARRTLGTGTYIGIYTDIDKYDPQALLQEFFNLLLARSFQKTETNQRKAIKEISNGHPTQSPRRRKHTVKAAARQQQ